MRKFLAALLTLLMLWGAADAETILFTADLHYGDGTAWKDSVLDALLQKAQEADVLILLGDVTNNGKAEEAQGLLARLADCGVPVLVLAGNHDLSAMDAASFNALFHAYGLDRAYSVDESSGSMAILLSEETDVVLLNTAHTDDVSGYVSDETLAWLAGIEASGRRVLVCGHHPILPHSVNESARADLTQGREALVQLLASSRLPLYLAGHRHIGHWSRSDGLTEILAAKTDTWPLAVGVLTLTGDGADFALSPLFTENDETLRQAEASTDALALAMGTGALQGTSFEGDEGMTAYFSRIYKAYLGGRLNMIRDECLRDARYDAWQSEEITSIFKPWLAFLLANATEDTTQLHLALSEE